MSRLGAGRSPYHDTSPYRLYLQDRRAPLFRAQHVGIRGLQSLLEQTPFQITLYGHCIGNLSRKLNDKVTKEIKHCSQPIVVLSSFFGSTHVLVNILG